MKAGLRARWWVGLALLAGVVGLGVYRWLAPRYALRAYKAQLRQAGVPLTIEDCRPPGSAENSAAARKFLAAAQRLPSLQGPVLEAAPAAMKGVAPGRAQVGWQQDPLPPTPGQHMSRATAALMLQRYGLSGLSLPTAEESEPSAPEAPTWADLAAEVQSTESLLAEIRAAAQAPGFDWNLDYSQGFTLLLPYLAPCKKTTQWLTLATLVALHEHRLEDALELLELQLRLVRNLQGQGLLIDELVRIAMATITWNATWEAWQADGWTDDQLARLQAAWQSVEFVRPMMDCFELERGVALVEYDRCRQTPSRLAQLGNLPAGLGGGSASGGTLLEQIGDWLKQAFEGVGGYGRAGFWATFQSWDDERFYIASIQALLDQTQRRVDLVTLAAEPPTPLMPGTAFLPRAYPEAPANSRRFLLANMALPAIDKAMSKAFRTQGLRDMAVTALALKRYQLAHHRFPDRLEDLVPGFLETMPVDWMDGRPLRYRLLGPGEFLLYSIGEDEIDDGGDPSSKNSSVRSFSPHLGRDFVWPAPATGEDTQGAVEDQ